MIFVCSLLPLVCRMGCLEHGMNCYARLVRAMLGPEAIAADKLMCGRSLVVLGVQQTFDIPPLVRDVHLTVAVDFHQIVQIFL